MLKEEIRNMKIDVMNDALAKALLRSEEAREVVATFISKVSGIDKELLINAKYVGGEIPKKKVYEKNKESDVMVLIDENHRIIVEINRNSTNYIFDKNSSYAMASIIEMTRPRNTRFPTVILINLDNFNKYHTKLPVLTFIPRDEEGNIETNLYKSIHIILENIVNQEYTIDNEIVKFAKLLRAKSIEELEKEFKEDDNYMKAINKIEELLMDPNFAGAYDVEERRAFDMEDMRLTGKDEGRAIGLIEGKKEKQLEIAKKMLKDMTDYNLIAKYTGLSVEEIRELEN